MKRIWLTGMDHEENRGQMRNTLIRKPWRERITWERKA